MFKGILIEKNELGYSASLQKINDSVLSDGDVTIAVSHSTLNYKDALAITGTSPIINTFPMIPGIDLAGTVTHSISDKFTVGDRVLLNGYGIGETHCGGLAQKARVKSEWLLPLPTAFSPRQAMVIGTAGYTAMLCVIALEQQGITPDNGKILVTGASGGVGSFAIAILAQLGYHVVASTGSLEQTDYLQKLGAGEVISRALLSAPGKALAKPQWAAAIDSAGSHTLANVCASIKYGGAVAACGLAQGMDFPTTVMPFILRGITLLGIDSVQRPMSDRVQAWARLAKIIAPETLENICTEISLSQVTAVAIDLLAGEVRGRVVVDVNL